MKNCRIIARKDKKMPILNNNMLNAINELDLNEADKQMLIDILSNERAHKSEEWSKDAKKHYRTKIDEKFDEVTA